ncbi:MAG: ABC transporter permease [Candidatus Moranbacteria bacterium]|nr:ABC transporter permease [Candidatus Moranbacteria bacterium]
MRFFDLIKLSLRMFKARTMRTLLTVFGMSIGIAAILFLVSFGYGLQKTLLERITTSDSLVTLDIAPAGSDSPVLDNEMTQTLREIPGVNDVVPAVSLSSQGKFDSIIFDLETTGSQASFLRLSGKKMLAGSFPNETKTEDTVVLTSAIANIFGKEPQDMIGKQFALTLFEQSDNTTEQYSGTDASQGKKFTHTYTIAGIVDNEENIAYVPLDTIDAAAYTHLSQLKVKCQSTNVMPSVRENIVSMNLLASSISETVDQANKVFRIIQIVLMLFGIIALVVSAIGMFNTMTIALLERTEEIGIMKSIGASKTSVSLMFIVEASLMGFLGGVFGVIFGISAGAAFNLLINLVASRFGGQSVSLFYSPLWFVVAIVVFGSFVGFLTGVFPARKASHIDPLDALRYK